jgi:hypothetical protein
MTLIQKFGGALNSIGMLGGSGIPAAAAEVVGNAAVAVETPTDSRVSAVLAQNAVKPCTDPVLGWIAALAVVVALQRLVFPLGMNAPLIISASLG